MTNKILIVEDDESTCELYGYILHEQGYSVSFVGDGAAALKALEVEPDIDLVVSDLYMPEMDGLEFLKIFRERFPKTRIVICSGFPDRVQDWSYIYNVFSVLTKPIEISSFLATIKSGLL